MPFPTPLLHLRSNAPGLPGPFLRENLAPYQLFDDLGGTKARAILAIGGQVKSRYLYDNWLIAPSRDRECSIAIAAVDGQTLLLDCDLHLQRDNKIPRVRGGPSTGEFELHLLRRAAPSAVQMAYDVYINVLSLFSDVVLIPLHDFGGLDQVVQFLCLWLARSITTKPAAPCRVVLLHGEPPSQREVENRIFAAFSAHLRTSDPTTAITPSAVRGIIDRCFHISSAPLCHRGRQHVNGELETSASERAGRGLDFVALHTKALLRAAIRHHVETPSDRFDFVTASRMTCPVPERLSERLTTFLRCHSELDDKGCGVVASALMMDAYPPDMHRFLPSMVFDQLYRNSMLECERSLGLPNLVQMVRQDFITLATEAQRLKLNSVDIHSSRLQGSPQLAECRVLDVCSFCIGRGPDNVLACGHRLCRTCLVHHGTPAEGCRYDLQSCPVCHRKNSETFLVRPPTAAVRVLSLSGTNPRLILQFLWELRQRIGLNTMALREHFDRFIGCDMGIFFVITAFMNGWDLSDCRHHLSSLERIYTRRGVIKFGSNLSWNLATTLQASNAAVRLHTGKKTFTSEHTIQDDAHVFVRFDGVPNGLGSVPSLMYASLFYIELASKPSFYAGSEICTIRVLCRVAPGNALLDLLYRSHRERRCIYYRGSEMESTKLQLCTSRAMDRCRNFEPFAREIKMEVASLNTEIQVEVDGHDGERYNVGRCPYKLKDLIRDQGLDMVFGGGRKPHQGMVPSCTETPDDVELEKLLDVLDMSSVDLPV